MLLPFFTLKRYITLCGNKVKKHLQTFMFSAVFPVNDPDRHKNHTVKGKPLQPYQQIRMKKIVNKKEINYL